MQVICATPDKASCNAKHVRLQVDEDSPFKVINRFALPEVRHKYFVSDPPHLMKTTRNNINSGDGAHTRLLWVSVTN